MLGLLLERRRLPIESFFAFVSPRIFPWALARYWSILPALAAEVVANLVMNRARGNWRRPGLLRLRAASQWALFRLITAAQDMVPHTLLNPALHFRFWCLHPLSSC